MVEGVYLNPTHNISINIKENTRQPLADTQNKQTNKHHGGVTERSASRGQEPWKISLGSLALRISNKFWKVLEASPEVAVQRLGS